MLKKERGEKRTKDIHIYTYCNIAKLRHLYQILRHFLIHYLLLKNVHYIEISYKQ